MTDTNGDLIMSSMDHGGFMVGAVAGGLAGLAVATGNALDQAAQHQRAVSTIGRWSRALDAQRQRAIAAERKLARAMVDNAALQKKMKHLLWELEVLRNA